MTKPMMSVGLAAMLAAGALIVTPGTHGQALAAGQGEQAAPADSMVRLRIILQKLQDAMTSMKDFDQLEQSGMPKKQVDRMRRAMQLKINQMMEEAIKNIHAL